MGKQRANKEGSGKVHDGARQEARVVVRELMVAEPGGIRNVAAGERTGYQTGQGQGSQQYAMRE